MEQNLGEEGAARTETNPGYRVSQLAQGQPELLALGNLRDGGGHTSEFPWSEGLGIQSIYSPSPHPPGARAAS